MKHLESILGTGEGGGKNSECDTEWFNLDNLMF